MHPDLYQKLAGRTECSQSAARQRYIIPRNLSDDRLAGDTELAVRFNHGAIGIVKEGGELLSLLEKWLHYGQGLDVERVKDELGDVMWYVALVANCLELSLDEIMEANIRKLSVRYPERYTDLCALNRDRAAEAKAISKPQ